MRILNIEDTDKLYLKLLNDSVMLPRISFNLNLDSHRILNFSSKVCSCLGNYQQCLLIINEYGIWSSSEHAPLYYKLKGDDLPLKDFPGHVFDEHDMDDLISYLFLVLIFGWGGKIFCVSKQGQKFEINFTHDSDITIASCSPCIQFNCFLLDYDIAFEKL